VYTASCLCEQPAARNSTAQRVRAREELRAEGVNSPQRGKVLLIIATAVLCDCVRGDRQPRQLLRRDAQRPGGVFPHLGHHLFVEKRDDPLHVFLESFTASAKVLIQFAPHVFEAAACLLSHIGSCLAAAFSIAMRDAPVNRTPGRSRPNCNSGCEKHRACSPSPEIPSKLLNRREPSEIPLANLPGSPVRASTAPWGPGGGANIDDPARCALPRAFSAAVHEPASDAIALPAAGPQDQNPPAHADPQAASPSIMLPMKSEMGAVCGPRRAHPPLYPEDKWVFWLHEEARASSAIPALISAGYGQLTDTPAYGSDSGAFGDRVAAALVRQATMRFFLQQPVSGVHPRRPTLFSQGLRQLPRARRLGGGAGLGYPERQRQPRLQLL